MYTISGKLDLNNLINKYSPLVKKIAFHVMQKLPANIEIEDLIQVGMIALMDTLNRFEISQGVQFETFATQRIRGAMLDELRSSDNLSRSFRKYQKDIDKTKRNLEQKFIRKPKDKEIANELNLSLNEFQNINNRIYSSQDIYLEDLLIDNDDNEEAVLNRQNLSNNLIEEDKESPEFILKEKELRTNLIKAIESLPERHQQIMSMYYEHELNFKEIALVLEITESRVCQIHNQIISKLKAKVRQINK